MATNKVPEVINDVRVYINGSDSAVTASKIELPEIKNLTADVTGIGLAGKIEAPIQGHFDSMECTISWQVPTVDNAQLFFLSRLCGGQHFAWCYNAATKFLSRLCGGQLFNLSDDFLL